MNIWEILGIEPTKDKKAIKKAYAEQSKIIHPEEKPDEFRILHEAYKAALEYTKRGEEEKRKKEFLEISKESPFHIIKEKMDLEDEETKKLIDYFQINIISKEKKLAYFDEHWQMLSWKSMDSDSEKWWKEYLVSEEFREIQWHPQVIHSFAKEIKRRLPHWHKLRIFLYELYDFEKENEYEGDMQILWEILHDSYIEHKKNEEWKKEHEQIHQIYEKKKKEREERREKYKWLIPIAVILTCLMIPLSIYFVNRSKENYVIQYMTEKYIGAEFVISEKGEKEEYGITRYQVYSSTHPDFLITVKIKNMNIDINSKKIEKTYEVEEDYGMQLMEYYAKQYDLEYGKMKYKYDSYSKEKWYFILYYYDIEKINEFCSKVIKMYEDQKELSGIGPIIIYQEDILFPEVMLEGGVKYFNIFERQFYKPATINAFQMSEQIRKAYITYMFNFEPWNITEQQYIEFGPEYKKICDSLEIYDGFWYTLCISEKKLYDIYIPIYESYYNREISIGNLYFFLTANNIEIRIQEEGKGFYIEGIEEKDILWDIPKVDFSIFEE